MATRDKDDDQGFLSRWSQRKRSVEQEAEESGTAAAAVADETAARQDREDGDGAAQGKAIDPAELPDIDSLGEGSDFSVFMQEGVPEALQRQALRKLWRLNPIFGHLDGLNDYDLDYTNAATVVENLKTMYQVGKGMVLPEEEEDEGEAAAEAAADEAPELAAAGDASAIANAEDAAAADATAAGEARPAPDDAAAAVKTRERNPGDPLVSGTTTRRSSTARASARSALSRRWGDSRG